MQWVREKFMTQIPKDIIERMIKYNIWNEDCPVPLERLQYLKIDYIDFNGRMRSDGEIIVLDVIADKVEKIFAALLKKKFPLAQIQTIDHYKGDDEKSMEDNNSSAFNCRKIMGQNIYSIHSYGLAIDINPVQNPYMVKLQGAVKIFPASGKEYVDRSKLREGMVSDNEVEIFRENKLIGWGGNWQSIKDWQHFEVSREHAEEIIGLSYREGCAYLEALS